MRRLFILAIAPACWLAPLVDTLAAASDDINGPSANDRAPPGGWKLSHFESTMKSLSGRSYSNGRRMFKRALCSRRHRFDNAAVEFGPDLAKLESRFRSIDILRDILDPSRRIADAKYDLWIVETDSGRSVAGMISRRTQQSLEVREN